MEDVYYKSTRGDERQVSSAEAILKGIADDGGLFIPTTIPKLNQPLETLKNLNYKELAYCIMKNFLTDFEEAELKNCIEQAYDDKFDTEAIAPLSKNAGAYFLELYHGPTLAFKDMALSILPHLLKTAAKKLNNNKEIVILTATSGDTGKAALEGFADVEGTKIIVFFPQNGVSEIQKRQMITQTGDNTYVIGIHGNFDDAQNGVKAIFTDRNFINQLEENNYMFSSANSINIGRLVPQIVYYFYAYLNLLREGQIQNNEKLNMVVPTGNFGNILAAYYAKQMGLPVNKLICASNDNKVLYDFIRTGVYDKRREFMMTVSPSMDILISSNLERLLYVMSDDQPAQVKAMMRSLSQNGYYEITPEMKEKLNDFYGGFASEKETFAAIKSVYNASEYLIDTHTAVAYSVYQKYVSETGDETKTVIACTASPYKFTRSVMKAIDDQYDQYNDFELLEKMTCFMHGDIPVPIKGIDKRPIRHNIVCEKDEMKETVANILGL